MFDQIRKDIKSRPEVFVLNNPLAESEIQRVVELWHPPEDLVSFWREFGTGDLFESEDILRPFDKDGTFEFVNARGWKNGLPGHLMVFHSGFLISAFDSTGFESFDQGSYHSLGRFETLDDWYCKTIREEFWQRYGLPKI